MFIILSLLVFSAFTLTANAATYHPSGCSATINSLSDVANAVKCTSITLNGFTVPAGKTLSLDLLTGTKVKMNGDIFFGNASWDGPLFSVSGTSVAFNGNGHKFDGGGPFYWDGQGTGLGVKKPDPMMVIRMSGTFTNVHVVNSPVRTYSVSNPGPLTMSYLAVDNSQGDIPNSRSKGLAAGRNTDGFDISSDNVIIKHSRVHNQDDCLAINRGTNIVFQGNTCIGGHGISIGSIGSGVTVSGVVISGNTVVDSDQAFRIKTKRFSTGSKVSNITYSGNIAKRLRRFGVLIDQSYPDTLGEAGSGVVISDVNFEGATTSVAVNSEARRIAVNCGLGSCQGAWKWADLKAAGGISGPLNHFSAIEGFRQ